VYLSGFTRKRNRFRPSPFALEVAGASISGSEVIPLPGPPEQEKDRETPPLEVSFSDIALFDECGYRYRKAIHHVLRRLAETATSNRTIPDEAALAALVDAEFYLPFADAPAFQRMYEAASRLVNSYVTNWASDLRRVWAVERPFELHLSDGTVRGRADIILDEEGGGPTSLAIVDYKVANDPVRDERYRLQLAVYAAAGRGEGLRVNAAYLHELRDGSRCGVDIGQVATKAAVQAVGESVRGIRYGVYAASPEEAKCRRCDFNRVCVHGMKVIPAPA
jgi:DNA helicase-2/ATP-dependent DNA helicase PcrA